MKHTVIFNQTNYQLNLSQSTDLLIITLITKFVKDDYMHEITYEDKFINDNLIDWMNKKFGNVTRICQILEEKKLYQVVKETGLIRFNLIDNQLPGAFVLKLNKKQQLVTKIKANRKEQTPSQMEIQVNQNKVHQQKKNQQKTQKQLKNKQLGHPYTNFKLNLRKNLVDSQVVPIDQIQQSSNLSKNNPFQQKQRQQNIIISQAEKKAINRQIKNLRNIEKYPNLFRKKPSNNQHQKSNQHSQNNKHLINSQIPFQIQIHRQQKPITKQQQRRTLRSHKRYIHNTHQQQQQTKNTTKKQRPQQEIKKLRKQNKELKQQLKLMKTQMEQFKTSILNQQQSQVGRIDHIERMLQEFYYADVNRNYNDYNFYQAHHDRNYSNEYHTYNNQTNNIQQIYHQPQVDKNNKCKNSKNQWRISEYTKITQDFQIQGLKMTYKRQKNLGRNPWSYIYLQNIINPNKIFTITITVHKCIEQNIALGIAFEKHTNKSSSWNEKDCYQYVGFSKIVFQGGRKKFQSGSGIWEGSNFTMIVNLKQGVIQWHSQRGKQACLQSAKLKNAKDKYVPFVRLKDRGDCIQFVGRP